MTLVKICGITNLEDALLSAKFGADMLGFNFYEKSPRYITPEKARAIIEQLPKEIKKVGVFVNASLETILDVKRIAGLNALQLHGEESKEFVTDLKVQTDSEIIKVFRISDDFDPESINDDCGADAIMLDTYSASEHGGTGEKFNWYIARKIGEKFPKIFIAGGLGPDNIADAKLSAKPFAVDACSRLESRPGIKDKIKLINFITTAKFIYPDACAPHGLRELLQEFRSRPSLQLGSISITRLCSCICGYITAFYEAGHKEKGNEYHDFFNQFHTWLGIETSMFNTSILSGIKYTLDKCEQDEEQAFYLYFALLEEFKLEKGVQL